MFSKCGLCLLGTSTSRDAHGHAGKKPCHHQRGGVARVYTAGHAAHPHREVSSLLVSATQIYLSNTENLSAQRQEIGVRVRCHQHELHSCCCPRPRRPRRSQILRETRLPDLVQARQVHVKPYMASASRRSFRGSCRSTYECIISPPAGMSHAATIRAVAGRLVFWTSSAGGA